MDSTLNNSNNSELQNEIELAIIAALNYVRENIAPYRTGNLAMNATNIKRLDDGTVEYEWEVYVDENIAPYMKYTQENWSNFAPPLYGKKNPNEGWWDRACEYIIKSVRNALGGEIHVGDVTDEGE